MSEIVGEFCYNKKDLIGHGAFAVVFKGQHRKKEDFVVAIKVISKKNLSKTQSLLAKEIKILKELHHENVVALFDCQERPSSVFLVMEYCNGGDLADYLQVKGTLSEDTIRIFLKQIASAMSALQTKGIVHRDLKPQNLLLNHSGSTNPPPSDIKVKIADFGFARFLPGEMMAATLCGSPMYMAPEVIMSKAYDAKADLWSLGTIVYQCLTGKAPFQANSPQALKKFYEKNKGVCPNIPAGTSSHIKDLLTGLLKRNPKDRMDFGEFFSHPFLSGKIVQRSSTPVAVPSRHRNYSGSSQSTSSSSPSYGAEALGDIRVDILHRMTPPSPYDLQVSPPHDMPINNPSSVEQSPRNVYNKRKRLSTGKVRAHSPGVDDEDFVMVPNTIDATDGTTRRTGWDAYFPYDCQSSPPRTSPNLTSPRTPPRRATFVVGSPNSPSNSTPISIPRPRSHSTNDPTNIQRLYGQSAPSAPTATSIPCRTRTSSSPGPAPNISPCSRASNPVQQKNSKPSCLNTNMHDKTITVVTQRSPQIYSQPISIKPSNSTSPGGSETSLVTAVARTFSDDTKGGLCNLANQPSNAVSRPTGITIQRALTNIEHQESAPLLSALVRQTNPGLLPLEALSERTEERGILKVHSSPAILATAVALPRNKSFGLSNTQQLRLGLGTNSKSRRHSSGPIISTAVEPCGILSTTPPSLPTIPGSPTKSCSLTQDDQLKPLKGLFTAGSSPPTMVVGDIIPFKSLPKYSGQENTTTFTTAPLMVTPGKSTKVTRGFSESFSGHQVQPLSPEMEGTIALIAPELPEDTLMETEHTDGVCKLNFALSLTDAILEVIGARRAPLTTIADSMTLRMNESLFADQIGNISEECRATEQLVLYLKTLRVLSFALRFAKEEVKANRLKPSNAVKNVVNDLNVRYHQCIERSTFIKTSLQGKMSPGKPISANADKLIYMYAMELCQNAALDELFGNPQQCREKYETAQLLLQGLENDVKIDSDVALLQKYKISVDRRLDQLNRRKASSNVR